MNPPPPESSAPPITPAVGRSEGVIPANAHRWLAKRREGLEYLQAAAGQLMTEHSGTSGTVASPAAEALAEAVARAYATLDDW